MKVQPFEADAVRAGPKVYAQELMLGRRQLSVKPAGDGALGLVTGQRAPALPGQQPPPVQPFAGPLPREQEAHAQVDAARPRSLRFP